MRPERTLVERILNCMLTDEDDQSERLAAQYDNASIQEKLVLDEAFTSLCGYRLGTLLDPSATAEV